LANLLLAGGESFEFDTDVLGGVDSGDITEIARSEALHVILEVGTRWLLEQTGVLNGGELSLLAFSAQSAQAGTGLVGILDLSRGVRVEPFLELAQGLCVVLGDEVVEVFSLTRCDVAKVLSQSLYVIGCLAIAGFAGQVLLDVYRPGIDLSVLGRSKGFSLEQLDVFLLLCLICSGADFGLLFWAQELVGSLCIGLLLGGFGYWGSRLLGGLLSGLLGSLLGISRAVGLGAVLSGGRQGRCDYGGSEASVGGGGAGS